MNKQVAYPSRFWIKNQAMPYLLIIDDMHPSLHAALDQNNISYDYLPDIAPQSVGAQLQKGYQGLILRSKIQVTKDFLQKYGNELTFIGRAGAGVDNIDVYALSQQQITLIHTPEGNRDAVAEHSLGMLLTLLNHLHIADREVRQGKWYREANRGLEIKGKTIGIIGFGNTGQAVAKRLQGFDCQILVYDRKPKLDPIPSYIQATSLDHICAQADIITLHIPLDTENYHWVNDDFFARCQKPIFLINAARGPVLDLGALCRALENGRVRGACLDVLENEKLDSLSLTEQVHFDYLRQSKRVLLTPHIAGWTYESYQRISEVMAKKVVKWHKAHMLPTHSR
ncbi:MAG: NAD(P)-dependent oxidoreductase [Bernardetiaceae bacterium]